MLLHLKSLLHRAARSHLSSAQGLPAPLTSLPLTSFCIILEARIFSMILASSSGGSWGQEKRALFFRLITCPWHSPSTEWLLAPLPVPQLGRQSQHWELGELCLGSPCWVRGCRCCQPSYTHPLPVLLRSVRPQHCGVCCVGPSSYTRAAREGGKSPRKEQGAWALLPMDLRKEICQNVHIPAPRHSPCHILVMPWHLYSPVVLYGPKGLRRAGRMSVRPCHMPPTHCHLPMATGYRQQHLTPLLSMQLFLAGSKCCLLPSAGFHSVPRESPIDTLCWHPGAPSTAPLAEHRLCWRWP